MVPAKSGKVDLMRPTKRGFALIEVLFAIFLLFIAALIVVATMPVATVSRTMSSQEDKAMDVCQKQIEAIRGSGYANANPTQLASLGLIDSNNPVDNSSNTYSFTNSDSNNRDNPGNVLPNGTGTIAVNQVNMNLVQITVTVNWTQNGTPRSYSLGTEMANL